MTRLSDSEIESGLADVPGWSVTDNWLHREVQLKNFAEALGFMVTVGVQAEKLNHHPNWSNVYNKVVIDISSHDEGGITDRCFALAAAVNRALGES